MNEHWWRSTYAQWKGWSPDDFGKFTIEEAVYFRKELKSCGVASVAGLQILELGFGNGAFAGWCTSERGHWCGIEAIPELVECAHRAGYRVATSADAIGSVASPSTLDVTVAFDVLEHVEVAGIRRFLEAAHQALRPSGLLIARMPSGDSPFSGAIFRGDLTHRTLLGSLAARQLLSDAGFVVEDIRATALPLRGLGLRRFLRRAVVSTTIAATSRLIAHIIMAQPQAVITPNMVLVARKP